MKRERAFELAYIEANFETEQREQERLRRTELLKQPIEEDPEDICKERCNKNLREGLDMVKVCVNSQFFIFWLILLFRLLFNKKPKKGKAIETSGKGSK